MKKENSKRFFIFAAIAILLLYGCGTSNDDIGTGKYEHQSGLSTNTELKSIVFSPNFQLFPTFSEETRNKRVYTASVYNNVEEVTIKPTIYDRFSTMTVNGVPHESGTDSEPIGLAAGENNFIEIEVTSESGVSEPYRITVFRSSNSVNTALAALAVSEGELEPSFEDSPNGENGAWFVSVPYETTQISITPTAEHDMARISVNRINVVSGSESGPINLNEGENEISIIVTAQETEIVKEYFVVVNRMAQEDSNDVTLSNVLLSTGNINPEFANDPDGPWTATVTYATSQLTITPEEGHPGQSITVNGNTPSTPVDLDVGDTIVEIQVTAEDGTTNATYQLTITRETQSDNVALSNLTLSTGNIDQNFANYPDGPWTASVAYETSQLTVTPEEGHPGQTITVNGSDPSTPVDLDAGANDVAIHVTAEDNVTTATYQLTITRAFNSDSSLSGLTINSTNTFTMIPSFDSNSDGPWTVRFGAASGSANFTITPSASDSANAVIRVNNQVVDSGSPSSQFSVNEESQLTIPITVTASDSSETEYELTVIHPGANANDNNQLAGLELSSGTLTPVFSPTTYNYSADVSNETESVTVTATKGEDNQTISINGLESPAQIQLPLGDTTVTVTTVAENGDSQDTVITVTRVYTRNANLESIGLSEGILTPTFDPDTTSYDVSVSSESSSITITPTAQSDDITGIEVNTSPVASGNPIEMPLVTGDNDIAIVVTADDGSTTKPYTVTVNRPVPQANTALSSLTVSPGTLDPLFSVDSDGPWALEVGAEVNEVTITAEAEDSNATVAIQEANGTLITGPVTVPEGATEIHIIVTSQSETQQYSLTINKASGGGDGPLLSDITIEMGTTIKSKRQLYTDFNTPYMEGDPAVFSPDKTEYAAVVYGFYTITVRAIPQTPGDISTITINGYDEFDSNAGIAEGQVTFREAGIVKAVEIIATDSAGNSTTYTVNVKLLNIFEFMRIVYSPLFDKSYDEKWEAQKPTGTVAKGNIVIPGETAGQLDWWVELSGMSTALNQMELTAYHDGQFGIPYNENGLIGEGLTVGSLAVWGNYNGYVEGDGYDIYIASETGERGDLVAHLDYQLKVENKEKVTDPSSWREMTYMGSSEQFHYRVVNDADCPRINPADNEGFDWYQSWNEQAEAPCFSNNFTAKE